MSQKKTPVFVVSSGSQPVKSGCGVSGPIFDPDVFVSGALFSVDGRSTLPGSENDTSMNQYLKDLEEELVLGDTPPQPFPFFAGSGALTLKGASSDFKLGMDGRAASLHTLKGASRDSNLGMDGRAASGNAQRAKVASSNAVPAGSGAAAPSLVGSGRRASRARRRVQFSSSDRCVPSSRKDFESCFEARERVITWDSDLAMLPLSSSLVPSLSMSDVSVGFSRGRVLSESISCVRCGVSLVVGSGALCESCTHVVSVCVHDSETDFIDHNSWKHGHEADGGTKALNQSSGYVDGCSFVDTVVG